MGDFGPRFRPSASALPPSLASPLITAASCALLTILFALNAASSTTSLCCPRMGPPIVSSSELCRDQVRPLRTGAISTVARRCRRGGFLTVEESPQGAPVTGKTENGVELRGDGGAPFPPATEAGREPRRTPSDLEDSWLRILQTSPPRFVDWCFNGIREREKQEWGEQREQKEEYILIKEHEIHHCSREFSLDSVG
ncbi:uncharacterized protein VTP21DRAFT_9193 [Calcarisporiella thermophila]|uniref:uncharacterized protein n=1 Tax=Calcarisporiella thermophila TaxID=911321 RepID=UPI003742D537